MRNRPDISYLTILGLSLTVVIAMQKGDSREDSVKFKLSDADGHHFCFLSVDAVRDAFLAVTDEKSSFIFGYNNQSYTALAYPIKVFVNIEGLCFKGATPMGGKLSSEVLTRDIIPDFIFSLTPSLCLNNCVNNTRFSFNRRIFFDDSNYPSAYPVRAGPEFFV